MACASLMRWRIPLLYAPTGTVRGRGHADTIQRDGGFLIALGGGETVHAQKPINELITSEAFGTGVELRAVTDHFAKLLRMLSGEMPSTVISPWVGRISPVMRFISVVFPDPLGPTRLVIPGGIGEADPVDAEDFAVESRDIREGDQGFAHRTTSAPRILRASI